MSLMDAPAFDERKEKLTKTLLIGTAITIAALVLLTLAGFLLGHGWLFTDLPAEHKVNNFFLALEAKDYNKAYALWTNDPDFAQHPEKHKDYTLARFTEDWTTASPAGGPITSHHVDISKTDGSGNFGTGIIVAVRVNGCKKLFMWYQKSDGTLDEPAPHELEYSAPSPC
jgi:hypothetical protein